MPKSSAPSIRSLRRAEMLEASLGAVDECLFLTTRSNVPAVSLHFRGKHMSAARAVWTLAYGDPGDRYVLHLCNGGSGEHGCVNARHLYLGDHADNMRDRIRGNRFVPPPQCAPGSANGNAKLTEAQVLSIRSERAAGVRRMDVARKYGVSPATITAVVKGGNWGWLA